MRDLARADLSQEHGWMYDMVKEYRYGYGYVFLLASFFYRTSYSMTQILNRSPLVSHFNSARNERPIMTPYHERPPKCTRYLSSSYLCPIGLSS